MVTPSQSLTDQYGFAHPFGYLFIISRKDINQTIEHLISVFWRNDFCLFWSSEIPFVSFHQNDLFIMSFADFLKSLYYLSLVSCRCYFVLALTHSLRGCMRDFEPETSIPMSLSHTNLYCVYIVQKTNWNKQGSRPQNKNSKNPKLQSLQQIPKIQRNEVYNLYILQNKKLKCLLFSMFQICSKSSKLFWICWLFCKEIVFFNIGFGFCVLNSI